ncbi:MAG: DJ-1/PfpI family protein [Pseudomonadales bacterium]|nr:DJ-1/PfpI family protein [Pseudomonadales bacterium]
MTTAITKVGILLFDDFELLDVFGPAQIFGVMSRLYAVEMVGLEAGTVRSAQGPRVAIDRTIAAPNDLDIVLVPGGNGTRREADNETILDWLRTVSASVSYVLSVCTGAGILASAGLLDDRQATSNKLAFEWVVSRGPNVAWQKKARWVEDGRFWTSSGVSAGIDMVLALIEKLHGPEIAQRVADGIEFDRHADPSWDPFAELYEWTRS